MRSVLILIASLSLLLSAAEASTLYFDMSQASGTEQLSNVAKGEFLFTEDEGKLRHCGYWQMHDGSRKKFEHQWSMDGSAVKRGTKVLGSYFDGNLMLEEILTGNQALSLEVTRFNETFFEYHFHLPSLGFVDGDGWVVTAPSASLAAICP